jgi:hypothetical protein
MIYVTLSHECPNPDLRAAPRLTRRGPPAGPDRIDPAGPRWDTRGLGPAGRRMTGRRGMRYLRWIESRQSGEGRPHCSRKAASRPK